MHFPEISNFRWIFKGLEPKLQSDSSSVFNLAIHQNPQCSLQVNCLGPQGLGQTSVFWFYYVARGWKHCCVLLSQHKRDLPGQLRSSSEPQVSAPVLEKAGQGKEGCQLSEKLGTTQRPGAGITQEDQDTCPQEEGNPATHAGLCGGASHAFLWPAICRIFLVFEHHAAVRRIS